MKNLVYFSLMLGVFMGILLMMNSTTVEECRLGGIILFVLIAIAVCLPLIPESVWEECDKELNNNEDED